ncbi:MAG TPA: hypothetical protein VJH88_04905 [Candidatus Nanoarchaeia archaeon]|nr:hypothetical protein [Candidatus Nanoarchaeia archaeon]
MKGDYTILDQPYRNAMTLVCGEFDRRGVEYAVIGGGAVQIQIVNAIEEPEKLTDLLRRTGDIDIVVDAPIEEMVLMFNELASEGRASNSIKGKPRVGNVSINYLVPGELKGVDHKLSLEESEYKRISGTQVHVETPEMI